MVDDVGAGYGNEDEPEKCRKQAMLLLTGLSSS
jgi:hypothetical protein